MLHNNPQKMVALKNGTQVHGGMVFAIFGALKLLSDASPAALIDLIMLANDPEYKILEFPFVRDELLERHLISKLAEGRYVIRDDIRNIILSSATLNSDNTGYKLENPIISGAAPATTSNISSPRMR